MKITADVIPHKLQRYQTAGDWQFNGFGDLKISVSQTNFEHASELLMVHEILEAILCRARGISEKDVDRWDCAHLDHPDPGSIPGCPYYSEHMFALMIERALAGELEVDWVKYEEVLEAL